VTVSDPLAEKIPDSALLQHALESSDEPVSVIIELDVPDPQVEYADAVRQGEDVKVPVRVVQASAREDEKLEQLASDARTFLDGLLAEPAVYIRSARAFIATANGAELDEIARRPFTKRIEPNRSLPPSAAAPT
jgi:hypothetical protein